MKNKALKRLISGLSLILISLPFFSFALSGPKDTIAGNGYKLKTIIIDPGHGGNHPAGAAIRN